MKAQDRGRGTHLNKRGGGAGENASGGKAAMAPHARKGGRRLWPHPCRGFVITPTARAVIGGGPVRWDRAYSVGRSPMRSARSRATVTGGSPARRQKSDLGRL